MNNSTSRNKSPMRKVGTAGVAIASLSMLAACGGTSAGADGGESVTLMAGHVLAESEPHHKIITDLAERVEAKTDGRIQIDVYPSSQLGSEQEVFEQAHLGNDVIAWGGGDQISKYAVPDFGVLLGPYVFEEPLKDVQNFMDTDLYREWTDTVAAKANLRVLAMNWYFGDRHLISDRAYKDPSSLKGVKVRVPSSPVFINIFKSLGATPVTLDWAEVYTGLSQDVVDAAEAPLSTIYNSKLYEVADTVTLTGHINSTVGWTMSEEVFQSLSEEDQEILLTEFQRAGAEAQDAFVEQEEEFRKLLEDEGVDVVEADIAAYQAESSDFYSMFPEWSDDLKTQVRSAVQ